MDIKKILFRTSAIDVDKALPDAVIFCNKDGKIQWVNEKACLLFNTSKMHLLTSNIVDFIENALNMISSSLISDSGIIVKLVTEDKYFDMSTNEVDEGYVLAFRKAVSANGYNSDEDSEEEEKINRNKNNFLLKIANDFKSPLQSIVGFSQAMTDGLGGSMTEQQEKYIKIIKKNSSELMYFINKLLELSQTENELREPVLKKFDVINMLNSLVKFNEQLYKGKEVRWNVNIESNLKNTVTSDEEIIKTILQNIIEVIIKSIDMGDVSVDLSLATEELLIEKGINKDDSYLLFDISSNSLLLSESDLESMFDPYKIVDTPNRKNLLRAIMLACVKNLVQTLNGHVWVKSQILKNTSFNILIPQN